MDTILYSQSKLKMNIDPIKHKNGWVIDLGMVGLHKLE